MTNICPTPTTTVNTASDSAAVSMPPAPWPPVKKIAASQTSTAPTNDQIQGLANSLPSAPVIAPASFRLISTRAASTTIRMAPLAATCQSGGMCMKVSSGEAASASVSAPITAPIGETRPPTNSPPPRMTPAIDSKV